MARRRASLPLAAAILPLVLVAAAPDPRFTPALPKVPQPNETYDSLLAKLGDGMLDNIVIRGVHAARTDARAHHRFYTDLQDMTAWPAYRPRQQVSGTIRVSGLYLHDGLIMDQWVRDFEHFQPGAKVVITQHGTIASGAVDIETGPRIADRLRAASEYEAATGQHLYAIDWATGSYNVPGWSPGFVIFVNKDNPIAHLSVQQLDGIFAGARTGGWDGTRWNPKAARGPEKNIRTWGQLGLKGEWADKPIHIYGRPLKYNIQLGFERKVFHGGDVWNENTREYSHEMNPDGTRYTSSEEMVKDTAADKYGIVFSDMGSAEIPGVRPVQLGATPKGPFVAISLQSLRDRSYPLFIEEWAETRLAPGQKLSPLVKEFLTFMLSREGQDAIQRDGKWIPIPPAHARAMIAKLDQTGEAVDPRELGLQVPMLAPRKWNSDAPDETGKIDPRRPYYTHRFDLSDLPAYEPGPALSGTIRMPASGQLFQSNIGRALLAAFAKYQPGINFDLKDGDLLDHQVDLSIGRRWTSYFAGEYYDFQLKYDRSPREIQIATGAFDVPGWDPAFAIYVNKANPVKGLTIRQLDGIFGGPRRGGWVSTAWRRQAGRTAEENIRSWAQLGAGGGCGPKPIDVYVTPLKYHINSVFERKVLEGGNMWNDSVREVPLALKPDGTRTNPSADRVAMVAKDKCGVTFAYPGLQDANARLVPIARDSNSPYVQPTLETVRDRTYPLALELYAYTDQLPSQPMDPRIREFLRFVLSRQGQEIVQADGKWLPLTADLSRAELAKLDAIIPQITAK